jgi:hypothetical protein
MQETSTLKINHMLKKSIFSLAMIGAVALALASSGGGGKKTATVVAPTAAKIKSVPGFSLKAGRNYSTLSLKNGYNSLSTNNSLLTYRKGNTIYILPTSTKYKPSTVGSRNNLNVVNFKLNLRK